MVNRNKTPPTPTRRPRGSASLMERAGVNEPAAIALPPAFEPKHEPASYRQRLFDINRYMEFCPAFAIAFAKIGEAHRQTGRERQDSIRYAIDALTDEHVAGEREVV